MTSIKRVGVVVNTIYSDYSVTFMKGIERYCAEKNCSYYLFPLEHGKNSGIYDYHCETLLSFINKNNLDGLVFASSTLANNYKSDLPRLIESIKMLPPIPKVSVGLEIEGIPTIKINSDKAMRDLVCHLVQEHGCKKIILMRCDTTNFESLDRERCVLKTLTELGVPINPKWILNGNFLFDNAYSSMANFLKNNEGADFDAVICLNDSMAMGVMSCLVDRGFKVPDSVKVTGFDNVFETSPGELNITTIDQRIDDFSFGAMETVCALIDGQRVEPLKLEEAMLVVRHSCGCKKENPDKNNLDAESIKRRYDIFRLGGNQLYMLHYFLMETQTPVPLDNLYTRLHYSLCLFDIHGMVLVLYRHSVYFERGADFKRPENANVAMTFFNERTYERPDTEFNPNIMLVPPEINEKLVGGGYTIYPIYAENFQYGYMLLKLGRYERIFYQSVFELISKEIVTSIKITGEQTEKNSLKNQNVTLEQYSEKMHRLSFTDEMTGLLNRRGFYEYAKRQIQKTLAEGRGGLVIYCDMDGLKKINDTYGHDVGDRAIKYEAQVLKTIFRSSDISGRLGGDEFAVLACDMKLKDFARVKRAMLAECDKINSGSLEPFTLSISVGCSEFSSAKDDIEELINIADGSQYEDKRAKKEAEKKKKKPWWQR
ncbi:MAG: GGDEF domain-containing protein [Treponema sp.]|nr:GGDEF domain-containing protein [Treponema sp.]